jgi:hypothetical protein
MSQPVFTPRQMRMIRDALESKAREHTNAHLLGRLPMEDDRLYELRTLYQDVCLYLANEATP